MSRAAVFAASLLPCLAGPATAHEVVIQPAATTAAAGQPVAFEVHSTHVFGKAEELEDVGNVTVTLVEGGGSQTITLTPNAKDLRLDGSFTLEAAGPATLVAHRHGLVFSRTTEGFKQGGRDVHANALSANKYEKFTKLIVNPGPEHIQPVGHVLEIVPLTNPAEYDVGQTVEVRVLHAGAPVVTAVTATRMGFTDVPGSYAWYTEGYDDGRAAIKFGEPGLWLVRAEYKADVPGDAVDQHIIRAILQVEVD